MESDSKGIISFDVSEIRDIAETLEELTEDYRSSKKSAQTESVGKRDSVKDNEKTEVKDVSDAGVKSKNKKEESIDITVDVPVFDLIRELIKRYIMFSCIYLNKPIFEVFFIGTKTEKDKILYNSSGLKELDYSELLDSYYVSIYSVNNDVSDLRKWNRIVTVMKKIGSDFTRYQKLYEYVVQREKELKDRMDNLPSISINPIIEKEKEMLKAEYLFFKGFRIFLDSTKKILKVSDSISFIAEDMYEDFTLAEIDIVPTYIKKNYSVLTELSEKINEFIYDALNLKKEEFKEKKPEKEKVVPKMQRPRFVRRPHEEEMQDDEERKMMAKDPVESKGKDSKKDIFPLSFSVDVEGRRILYGKDGIEFKFETVDSILVKRTASSYICVNTNTNSLWDEFMKKNKFFQFAFKELFYVIDRIFSGYSDYNQICNEKLKNGDVDIDFVEGFYRKLPHSDNHFLTFVGFMKEISNTIGIPVVSFIIDKVLVLFDYEDKTLKRMTNLFVKS